MNQNLVQWVTTHIIKCSCLTTKQCSLTYRSLVIFNIVLNDLQEIQSNKKHARIFVDTMDTDLQQNKVINKYITFTKYIKKIKTKDTS